MGGIKGDTRSLDCRSYDVVEAIDDAGAVHLSLIRTPPTRLRGL